MKKQNEIPNWVVIIAIIIIVIGVASFSGFDFLSYINNNNNNEETKIEEEPLSVEDCKSLSNEAGYKITNCILTTLEEIYNIGYEPNLKDGGSCYYSLSNDYCLDDEVVSDYYYLAEESCSKSFPNKDDVFTDCLANIK